MELRWTDNNTRKIGVTFVTDEDVKILRFVGYAPYEEEDVTDEDGELVEIWMPEKKGN